MTVTADAADETPIEIGEGGARVRPGHRVGARGEDDRDDHRRHEQPGHEAALAAESARRLSRLAAGFDGGGESPLDVAERKWFLEHLGASSGRCPCGTHRACRR